jgi:hypothetical protein
MIRPKVCLVANAVIQDSHSNMISVFNVLERISAVGMPFCIQNLSRLTLWERQQTDPADYTGTFTVFLNDEALATMAFTLSFGAAFLHRTILNFPPLIVSRPGNLRFLFHLDVNIEAEYGIGVEAPPQPVQVQGGNCAPRHMQAAHPSTPCSSLS